MSRLSSSRAGQEIANPPVSSYLGAYGLWFITFFAGLLVAYLVRDVYQMAVVFTTLDRYAVHLFGQLSVVILVVLLLILLVTTEAYYRHGVPRRQAGVRFARVMGILALVLAAAQGFRLVLEVVAGSVNLVSVLIFGLALVCSTWRGQRDGSCRVHQEGTGRSGDGARRLPTEAVGVGGDRSHPHKRGSSDQPADQVSHQCL